MSEPLINLLVGSGILILFVLLVWPKGGIIGYWKRLSRNNKRVMIEDALKNIYDCEYRKADCSLQSLKGGLSVSSEKVALLTKDLEEMNLIKTDADKIVLTPEGRSYALRIVRIHRLLERHFADRTSFKAVEWHEEAENAEHKISYDDANKLAVELGNPLYDPHGDPIPTEKGHLPPRKGVMLNNLKPGDTGRIIHIEDEPKAVYSQIVAQGLHPGMQINVLESNSTKIKFTADTEECVLAPVFASNILVSEPEEKIEITEDFILLSNLKPGQYANVVAISKACRGQQRRRLMDFGIVPGTKILSDLESLGGDPKAYIVRGTKVALRRKQASQIYITEPTEK